jgi:hypothetical protein
MLLTVTHFPSYSRGPFLTLRQLGRQSGFLYLAGYGFVAVRD